eukprot:1101569-Alexandrium_andersonii.AAC.1
MAETSPSKREETPPGASLGPDAHSPGSSAHYNPWDFGSCVSVFEKFAPLQGRVLQDRLRSIYLTGENKLQHFYTKDQEGRSVKLMTRHELNDRDQHDTRQKYKELVRSRGIV